MEHKEHFGETESEHGCVVFILIPVFGYPGLTSPSVRIRAYPWLKQFIKEAG